MSTIESAFALLHDTEDSLKELLVEATHEGDYVTLGAMSEIAAGLAELIERLGLPSEASALGTTHLAQKESSLGTRAGVHVRSRLARNSRSRGAKSRYPKFYKTGEGLVKVGWSKRERREYRHRATRAELSAVARSINSAAAEGRQVTTEDFLPVTDLESGTLVPDYRAYVCLAWLRSKDLVLKHGRDGYSIKGDIQEATIEDQFNLLEDLPGSTS